MKPSLYIETSVISYLVARPSRDLLVAAHQHVTQVWWTQRRAQFELYASPLVVSEASQGDPQAAADRLRVLQELPLLELRTEARDLAERFVRANALPLKAIDDALHIATATIYGLDYLVTWNCTHIANAEIQKSLVRISVDQGYTLPTICTLLELMGA